MALASPAADATTVDETAVASPTAPMPARTAATPAVLLARGTLISHEHATSGTVSVVRQPDGSRVLVPTG